MLEKLPTEQQQTMWAPPLEMMLNPDHQLVKLAKRLPWEKLEAEFGSLYAVIGHLKAEHRLCRNYLHGVLGDELNVLLAAVGWNLKKLMRLLWLLPEGLFESLEMVIAMWDRSDRGRVVLA